MQKKKGISLIVLVITIIVMIILAGAIILTLNNNKIVERANEAVDKTNEATIKQVAQLGWAEAYAKHGADQEKLYEGVMNALTKIKVDLEEYGIKVTTKGVMVKAKKDMWIKDGFTVVRGEEVLKIGDTINYTATGTTYNDGWKVLGADDEGNLLILSAKRVAPAKSLGVSGDFAKSQQDWLNGIALLDAECEPFGKGVGVVGKARSITIEDVNSVTGYDPETAKYSKGNLDEYGNEVTFAWDGDSRIKCTSTNGKTGSASYSSFSAFTWYDEKTGTFQSVLKGDTSTALPTIKSTSYNYNGKDLTTISATDNKEAYDMIFGVSYCLASPSIKVGASSATYGYRVVSGGAIGNSHMWYTYGGSIGGGGAIRAVVTLQSDIQVTGSSETGWSYTVK